MDSLRISVALARHQIRDPLYLATLSVSWVAALTVGFLLPLGLTTSGVHELSAHYELAFLASGACVAVGMHRVAAYRALTDATLGSLGRTAAEGLGLLLPCILPAGILLVAAHLGRSWQPGTFRMGESLAGLMIGLAWLGAVALLISRWLPPRPAALGPLTLALLCWVLPAAAGEATGIGRGLTAILDVSRPLRSSFDSRLALAEWGAATLSLVGWWSLAIASAPKTSIHALRSPR